MIIPKAKPEDAGSTAIRECRLLFLRAAAQHPRIKLWESLHKEVFESGRKFWKARGVPLPQPPGRRFSLEQWTEAQWALILEFGSELHSLVETWAKHHHLHYEWVRETALPFALGFLPFPIKPFPQIPGYAPPEFRWPAWNGQPGTKGAYRASVTRDFSSALEAYIKSVESQRRPFLKHRGSQAANYSFAAEFVCLEWGWAHIARQAQLSGRSITPQGVSDAVLPILERVGIPRRHRKLNKT